MSDVTKSHKSLMLTGISISMHQLLSKKEEEIVWRPWEKKFAVLPRKIKGKTVWAKYYYERKGATMFFDYTHRVNTLFDVIGYDGKNILY